MRLVARASLTPPPQQFCLEAQLTHHMGEPPELHTLDHLLQRLDVISFQVRLIFLLFLFRGHLELAPGVLVDIPVFSQDVLNSQHLGKNTQEPTRHTHTLTSIMLASRRKGRFTS